MWVGRSNVVGYRMATRAAWMALGDGAQRPYVWPMATQELHRGRLIDHVQLVVADLSASKRFYTALFEVLGVPVGGEGPDFFWTDELFISTTTSRAAAGKVTGPTHLAFQAKDRAMVDRCYAAAIAIGARDNGAPGVRPYHPGYYAAFVLDPDGNNIEVVHHGEAKRSADSVKITF
jgi:catechol 2,3-dioxygenase-like lactoylglutathione lyase family enzyme